MSFSLSPNMNLPVPGVGTEDGPQYAVDVNNCLTIIDGHNHTAGYGVPITPAAIDINSDLPANNNNITLLRTLRFTPQSAVLTLPADIGCLYEVGVDLYYNDGSGNNVRLTQSGAVAGTPGSIANLTPPASASYSSAQSTFIFQSDVNTPANIDGGSFIFRNITANSNGVTLSAPSALASSYVLTLPLLPAAQKFMTLDATGNIAAPWSVDNASIVISSNNLTVGPLGIQTSMINTGAVTPVKMTGNTVVSSSCGNFSQSGGTPTLVTNLSCAITTVGKNVDIFVVPDNSTGADSVISAPSVAVEIFLYRNGSPIAQTGVTAGTSTPVSILRFFDPAPAASTYTYEIYVTSSGGGMQFNFAKLVVREVP